MLLAGRWLGQIEIPNCAQWAAAEIYGPFFRLSWAVWTMPLHVWFREQPEKWPWCLSWDPPIPFGGAVIALIPQASKRSGFYHRFGLHRGDRCFPREESYKHGNLGKCCSFPSASVFTAHQFLPAFPLYPGVCDVCKCTFYSMLIVFCGKVCLMWGLPSLPEAQLVFKQLKVLSADCV